MLKDLLKRAIENNMYSESELNQMLDDFVKTKKITIEDYKELTGKEYELTLEEARELKRAEIKRACFADIEKGFYSDKLDGVMRLFGMEYFDEMNWIGALAGVGKLFSDYVPVKYIGGTLQQVPIETFLAIMRDGMVFKFSNIGRCDMLENMLDNAKTIEEINQINW